MKKLVKLLSIAALLSTNTFADGSGPSNKEIIKSCRGVANGIWGDPNDMTLNIRKEKNSSLRGAALMNFEGGSEELSSTRNVSIGTYNVQSGLTPEFAEIELLKDLNPGERFIVLMMVSLDHHHDSWDHLKNVKGITVYDFDNFGEFSSEKEADLNMSIMTAIGEWKDQNGELKRNMLLPFTNAECQ